MRFGRCAWLVALVGCSGDKDTPAETGSDPTDTPIVIACDLPSYDLSTLACDELAHSLGQVAQASADCNEDADCRVIHPSCEQWAQAECYYSVNSCLTPQILSEYNGESVGCTGSGGYSYVGCTCEAEPAPACHEHKCTFAE